MKNNIWTKLKEEGRPVAALAPMAGFTDSAFRQICSGYGADVVYSEMASATALYYRQAENDNETLRLLAWDPKKESPYIVQLFGSDPGHFAAAAKIVETIIKPDGIDINLGCPVGKVLKQGAGADLMRNRDLAKEVIKATIENTSLPVSVKIRAKSGEVTALDFLRHIKDLPVAAVMIHGRTLSQGFAGEADYSIGREARKYFSGVIMVNGGINDLDRVKTALAESKADGIGLGRGALARPWLFQEIKEGREIDYERPEICGLLFRHASLMASLKGEGALVEWRKQACWYVQGLRGASALRSRLVQVTSLEEVKQILNDYALND